MIKSLFSKNFKSAAYWFTAIISCVLIIAANNPKNITILPAAQCPYKAIIFDIGDVLLTTSTKSKATTIIPSILLNPSSIFYLPGMKVQEEFFKILHQIPTKTTEPMYHQSKRLPQIMVDWMTNQNTSKEVISLVHKEIDKSNHQPSVKKLFKAITLFMFDPKTLAKAQIEIEPMVNLAKQLKSHGYKLYILSNWEESSYQHLATLHPQLFKLFDGIVTSGEEKIGKPNPQIYTRLLKKYNLKAHECLFIDDEINNTIAAETMGIRSIVCSNALAVCKGLINCGVMILSWTTTQSH